MSSELQVVPEFSAVLSRANPGSDVHPVEQIGAPNSQPTAGLETSIQSKFLGTGSAGGRGIHG